MSAEAVRNDSSHPTEANLMNEREGETTNDTTVTAKS
jgi:hypothetical protein